MNRTDTVNDQMSLRECGESDRKKNLREQLTGWGRICKLREAQGISRSIRVKRNKERAI